MLQAKPRAFANPWVPFASALGLFAALAVPGCSKASAPSPPSLGGTDREGERPQNVAETPQSMAVRRSTSNLVRFGSWDEVRSFIKDDAVAQEARVKLLRARAEASERARRDGGSLIYKSGGYTDAGAATPQDGAGKMLPSASPAPAAAAPGPAARARSEARGAASITNNQHAGVDEGDIVKFFGKHLVVLRRGRLFSLRVDERGITPVDRVDAFGPDIDPRGTWYDELLISDKQLVVVGFSYERGGTEVGFFDLDDAGHIQYRVTYHFRSNDYYSARNYSSRLLGDKLVFYMPLYLNPHAEDPLVGFPAVRRWHKGATEREFARLGDGTGVFRPADTLGGARALHSVVTCDLSARTPTCDARSVMGGYGRTFYVSPRAVYVWSQEAGQVDDLSYRTQASLFQLPLNGGAPARVRVSGAPIDQFSFLEGADEQLNVFVRGEGNGDAMWSTELRGGDAKMLRFSLARFDGADTALPEAAYRELPAPSGYAPTMQNRFVGDTFLYGSGNSWGHASGDQERKVYAFRYKDRSAAAVPIHLAHGVDRIEALGQHAVVVGADGKDLHFSSLDLQDTASVRSSFVLPHASQGELRSHGFFFREDAKEAGLLGLPVRSERQPGYAHLFQDSAFVLFLKVDGLKLSTVGRLESRTTPRTNDGCRASCVDWYGNARPIFLGDRIFALLGYELVEGKLVGGQVQEVRRAHFAPPAQHTVRRDDDEEGAW
jgi:hypothetical protein